MSGSAPSRVLQAGREMVAYVNGWRMWGEPAPSVRLPPELEFESQPTVCGYAPTRPEPARSLELDALPPAIDPALPVEIPDTPAPIDITTLPLQWALAPLRFETTYEFYGTEADDNALTFMGALAIDPECHEPTTHTVLADNTSWILAIVGAVCLAAVLVALFSSDLTRGAESLARTMYALIVPR